MKVAELIGLRQEVFSITEDTTVHEGARYLREKQVRAVGRARRPRPAFRSSLPE